MIRGIRRRETFAALRTQGFRVRRRGLAVVYVPTDSEESEVAYAISRRAATAVQRNRCRRRLRVALGELDQLGLLPRGAYVISVAPESIGASQAELLGRLADMAEVLANLPVRSG